MKAVFMKGWRPALVLLLLLFIWEVIVNVAEIPGWLLPAPTAIFKEMFFGFGHFSSHLISTIGLSLAGFCIGCSVGLLAAILLHLVPKVQEGVYPLLILSQNVPIIVLAPLLVIWFGFGILPKIIVITLVCFFPVTIASLGGFRNTPPEMKHYMLMAGASKIQMFTKLEWPNSLPSL